MTAKAISKLDAARRQLLAAIHIHWYLCEPLAVYSLASNAWEISDAILKQKNKLRLLQEIADVHGSTARELKDLINRPRNFIKHADRDPDELQEEIDDGECDSIIETACIDYMMAAGRSHSIMGLYLAWFSAVYPDKTGGFFKGGAEHFFPGLSSLERDDQMYAARIAALKPVPRQVLNDYRNELTDNYRWARLRELGTER